MNGLVNRQFTKQKLRKKMAVNFLTLIEELFNNKKEKMILVSSCPCNKLRDYVIHLFFQVFIHYYYNIPVGVKRKYLYIVYKRDEFKNFI